MDKYLFPEGVERVLSDTDANQAVPWLLDRFGYSRAFVICSRSLNANTNVVTDLSRALGDRFVGLSEDVGDHSPILKLLSIAEQVRDFRADVIVTVGGGSVMDATKTIQLVISEGARTREELLDLQFSFDTEEYDYWPGARKSPSIRQIAVPTTLASAEWTPAATPVDEATRLKARFYVPDGTPQAIVYDASILAQTPTDLLLSTGIRGLDHAVNTYASTKPSPFASVLAEKAIILFFENLPRLAEDRNDVEALKNCQLATWYTGMGQMSVPHGFSHTLVHVVGPYTGVRHSDAACALMLAQAKWNEALDDHPLQHIPAMLGRSGTTFPAMVEELLKRLGLPTTLAELGVTWTQVEEMIPLAIEHPTITKFNLRPMVAPDEIRAAMALAEPAA